MQKYYIYYHIDPRDGQIRYIGKGKNRRAWALSNRHAHHKNWINELKQLDLKPIVQIVEYFEDEALAFEKEREMIKSERERGIDLCNVTDGGEGCVGLKGSLNSMYGKKRPDFVKWMKENNPTRLKNNKYNVRKIKCIETNIEYNSVQEASEILNINLDSIRKVLSNKYNNIKGLSFIYLDGKGPRIKSDTILKQKSIRCIESNIIYKSVTIAAKELKLEISGIYKHLRGKRSHVSNYTFKWV